MASLWSGLGELLVAVAALFGDSNQQGTTTDLGPGMDPWGGQDYADDGDLGPGMDPWG